MWLVWWTTQACQCWSVFLSPLLIISGSSSWQSRWRRRKRRLQSKLWMWHFWVSIYCWLVFPFRWMRLPVCIINILAMLQTLIELGVPSYSRLSVLRHQKCLTSVTQSKKMPCAHCAREFSLFHREYACPACGFSHCSSCLKYKVCYPWNLYDKFLGSTIYCQVVLPKTGRQEKVCLKCHTLMTTPRPAPPPSPPKALQKRLEKLQPAGVSGLGREIGDFQCNARCPKGWQWRTRKLQRDWKDYTRWNWKKPKRENNNFSGFWKQCKLTCIVLGKKGQGSIAIRGRGACEAGQA